MQILKKLAVTKTHWRAFTGAAAGFMLISASILQLTGTAHTQPLSAETTEEDAALMAVPGSRMSLVPPSGFVPAHRFHGYQAVDATAFIVFDDSAQLGYKEVLDSLSPNNLLRKGQEAQSTDTLTIDGRDARLVRTVQRVGGRNLQRWFLAVDDGSRGILISVAGGTEELLDEQIVNSLQTLTIKDAPAPSLQTTELAFAIEPAIGFELVRQQDGTQAWFSKASAGASNKAYFVANLSAEDICGEMLLGPNIYIQRAAKKIKGVNLILEQTEKPTSVLGFEGLENVGRGFDPSTGKRLMTYQAAAIDGCSLYRVVGVSPFADMSEFLPLFQKMTASLSFTNTSDEMASPESEADPAPSTPEPASEPAASSGDQEAATPTAQ